MKPLSEKKGQVGNINLILFGVMTVFIVGVLLIMGLIMMDELWDETKATQSSNVDTNETLTTVTEAGEAVAKSSYCGCKITSIVVTNATHGTAEIVAANYTTDGCTVKFYGGDDTLYNNTDWNVTYGFTFGSESCTAGNETMIGVGKFGDYIDLIVLAIIISIIISLILVGFAPKKVR